MNSIGSLVFTKLVIFSTVLVGCSSAQTPQTISGMAKNFAYNKNIEYRILGRLITSVKDDPISHFDVYEEFDLNQDHYLRLLDSVFRGQDSIAYYKNRLNENLSRFVNTTRMSVLEDMKRNHSLEGMDFSYLVSRRDICLPELVQAMLKDEKFDEEEKTTIVEKLTKEFRRECLKIATPRSQDCHSLSLTQLFELYYQGK